jgi:hypothetical protein
MSTSVHTRNCSFYYESVHLYFPILVRRYKRNLKDPLPMRETSADGRKAGRRVLKSGAPE